MRNLFDQYEVPENRVTHALACCLSEDPTLLRRFVRWSTGEAPVAGRLKLVQQQIPGEPQGEDELTERGLPDMWIYGDGPWALLVENKVASRIGHDQLRRHQAMAVRHGFSRARLLVLSPEDGYKPPDGVLYRSWPEVYRWASREARRSGWARRLVEYLEIAENRMVAKGYLREGALTDFNGFCFDAEHPYSYREAKRLLSLALPRLQKSKLLARHLDMDPAGEGRPAITGTGGHAVWDFLPLRVGRGAPFIRNPHLTLAVADTHVEAFVTIPSGAASRYRRSLLADGEDGFRRMVEEILEAARPTLKREHTASPRMYALQRRYPSQRAAPINDARLDFDLRTVVAEQGGRVKPQPQWLSALYEAIARKRSNLQIGVGIRYFYGSELLGSSRAIELVESGWLACLPLLRQIGAVGSRNFG
jgi:hypothetical protein